MPVIHRLGSVRTIVAEIFGQVPGMIISFFINVFFTAISPTFFGGTAICILSALSSQCKALAFQEIRSVDAFKPTIAQWDIDLESIPQNGLNFRLNKIIGKNSPRH